MNCVNFRLKFLAELDMWSPEIKGEQLVGKYIRLRETSSVMFENHFKSNQIRFLGIYPSSDLHHLILINPTLESSNNSSRLKRTNAIYKDGIIDGGYSSIGT